MHRMYWVGSGLGTLLLVQKLYRHAEPHTGRYIRHSLSAAFMFFVLLPHSLQAAEAAKELAMVGSTAPTSDRAASDSLDTCLIDEHVHYSHRSPWLRAFVLGANDGLVSVASLMVGIAGGSDELSTMRLAGLAAWIAGALSSEFGWDRACWWRYSAFMQGS